MRNSTPPAFLVPPEIYCRLYDPARFSCLGHAAELQSLALGRLWHFFFRDICSNGLLFAVYAFCAVAAISTATCYQKKKRDIANLWEDILDHLRLRFAKGEEALHYNVLQKLAYFTVIFVIAPLIVLTGLTMSPTMDSAVPQLLFIFGGRQSARTVHFICAFAFVGFFLIHIAMVILSGPINNLRAIITGHTAIVPEVENG